MKKSFFTLPVLRGLTAQLFVITILPLTLLLLLIAFGSYSLHQRDMRTLVSERDERAVQSATAALESELHHCLANISSLATYVDASGHIPLEKLLSSSSDLASDFDGGMVFLSSDGKLIASTHSDGQLDWIAAMAQSTSLASP